MGVSVAIPKGELQVVPGNHPIPLKKKGIFHEYEFEWECEWVKISISGMYGDEMRWHGIWCFGHIDAISVEYSWEYMWEYADLMGYSWNMDGTDIY